MSSARGSGRPASEWRCPRHPKYEVRAKQDYLNELCDLVGIDRHEVRRGSTLRKLLFNALAAAVGVSNNGAMPVQAERIARKMGLDWHQCTDSHCTFDSRLAPSGGGSTVTARGMECLVKATKKHLRNRELADSRLPRKWLLQCSPQSFDIFQWWIDGNRELGDWSVSQHLDEISIGDDFALWVGGKSPGVYAIGEIDHHPEKKRSTSKYWKVQPSGPLSMVGLRKVRFFFDAPIAKSTLLEDPNFAESLVVRMPRTANPIPLTQREWKAIVRHDPHRSSRRTSKRRRSDSPLPAGVTVTSRGLGVVPETTTVTSIAGERLRDYSEAQLVDRYARSHGRTLQVLSARTPDGRRLVADAFDPARNLLIEAKAQTTRSDIRMAIGQLFDYQLHLAPTAKLSLLLPEKPPQDLQRLLRSLSISVIVA